MKRGLAAVAAFTALAVSVVGAAAVAKTKRPTVGPRGTTFYFPNKLPKGPHGTLIWKRGITGGQSLSGAKNYLVDYKQLGLKGKMVPVSGIVAIPNGRPPKGGWPVITWAHGTTGIADVSRPPGSRWAPKDSTSRCS